MTRFATQCALLYAILVMAVLFWASLGHPMQEFFLLIATGALLAASLLMERLRPFRKDWNTSADDTLGDIGSFVIIFGLLDGVLKWASPFVILALLPQGAGLDWPLWVQIITVTLVIEFGAWISHWAHHRFAPLWALHAMHHSPERLYTLNNFRFHPLNHILNHGLMILPAMALGFAPEALLAYVALSTPILIFQHTNADLDFGILNRLFNTNDLHRWHHSTARDEGTHNLGRALVIWDHVFGTYLNPADRDAPSAVGLFATSRAYPKAANFMAQILWPFARCCRKPS